MPTPTGADVALSVKITRGLLGLSDLELNDGVKYKLAPGSWGAQVAWDRQTVTSRWVDGEVTTSRRRQRVEQPLVVEVYGTNQLTMETWTGDLVDALCQAEFVLTWTVNKRVSAYHCEAADYQEKYTTDRMASFQGQVSATVPTQPRPLLGRF